MKTLIKHYFGLVSKLAPGLAARQAFNLFQRPINKKLRPKEQSFFKATKGFKIKHYLEDIQCYELGPNDGKLVVLVHGWESNAASMSGIGLELAEQGYHVVLFNLPAHGSSKLKKSNMKICKEVFLEVINHVNPSGPFSVVAHSFGSAVATYALSKTTYPIENLVLLTTPNKIKKVFKDYADFIKLGDKAYHLMCNQASNLLKEPVENLEVDQFHSKIRYDRMTLIQDEFDKVVPKKWAIDVYNSWERSDLKLVQNVGHYRMLWNREVIDLISNALANNSDENVARLKAVMF